MLKVTFYGAAQEVTGSLHLLEVDGLQVALDCGMFQGKRSETQVKNESFPFDPAKLHAVVLSHAHVDHCGRLPLLAKRGFTGHICATPATRDLAALLMADSAHIQMEDSKFLNKKRAKNGEPFVEPLYTEADAARACQLFNAIPQERDFQVAPHLAARFYATGHMLGACFMELTYSRVPSSPIKLIFSGDIGRYDLPILEDPHAFPLCDYLITESTYGGRRHPPAADLKGELARVIQDAVQSGGRIIVPAFSVGRTQVVVYMINQLVSERRIPAIPVFVDSPLAVNATEVFRLHPELFDAEARELLRHNGDILGSSSCTYIRDVEESKRLNGRPGPMVIISASGMCENGRIVHHLANNIEDGKNTVLIVGFQAANTLGRRLTEKQSHVTIFGKPMTVRAKVVVLNGFSGHADCDELEALLKPIAAGCRGAFLVHGEMDQMQIMRDRMRGDGFKNVELPAPGATYDLDGAGSN